MVFTGLFLSQVGAKEAGASSHRLARKIFMLCSTSPASPWLSAAPAACTQRASRPPRPPETPSPPPPLCPSALMWPQNRGKGWRGKLLPGRPSQDWVAPPPIPAPAFQASRNLRHPDIPKLETWKRPNEIMEMQFQTWSFISLRLVCCRPILVFRQSLCFNGVVSDDKWS